MFTSSMVPVSFILFFIMLTAFDLLHEFDGLTTFYHRNVYELTLNLYLINNKINLRICYYWFTFGVNPEYTINSVIIAIVANAKTPVATAAPPA